MEKYIVEVYENRTIWFNEKSQKHRLDGPAVEYKNGTKYWYKNGIVHRTDGPAVEYSNGGYVWSQNGTIHRTDGPAIEYANGNKAWYINGEKLTEEQFNNRNKPCKGKKVIVDGVEYTLS